LRTGYRFDDGGDVLLLASQGFSSLSFSVTSRAASSMALPRPTGTNSIHQHDPRPLSVGEIYQLLQTGAIVLHGGNVYL